MRGVCLCLSLPSPLLCLTSPVCSNISPPSRESTCLSSMSHTHTHPSDNSEINSNSQIRNQGSPPTRFLNDWLHEDFPQTSSGGSKSLLDERDLIPEEVCGSSPKSQKFTGHPPQ